MLSSFEYDYATGLLLKQNYGNGDCINYSYDNLDRLSYKIYNGDGNRKLSYSYGRDGNIASNFDSATGEKTVFCYDLANRAVGQKTYVGSTLSSSLAYTYADKTNYLVGVKHKFALGEQTIGYRYGNLSIGEMPDQIYGVTWNGKEKIGYSYDGFGRITDKTVMPSLSKTLHNRYTYYNRESGNRTSTTVKSLETANGTYTYTYDAVGNILSINDGTYTVSYVYDGLNQLVRENDQRADTTTVYTYTNGNITGKKVYKYTLGDVGEEIKSASYGYSNSEWRDLLTSFNGQAVTYDEIGNPLTFGSKSFEWCGRQLERITDGDNTYVYAYNTDGDRVSKTVNGVKTEYFYNGSILAGQKTGDETLIFMYDNNGDAFGFIYNGEEYYYIKNVQNDIVAIADKNGDIVANYYYDAWGNVTQITGNTALAQTNPLRYRSYYYDSETGYYHLKSRYYSPEVGRFLNSDSVIDNRDISTQNLFQYCGNNPINNADSSGNLFGAIVGIGLLVIGMVTILSGCSSKPTANPPRQSTSSKPSNPSNSSSSTTPHTPTSQEKSYAATVYAEAGGQNKRTKQAVAHVMKNRIGKRASWTDIESVISAKYQFDGYNSPMYQSAMNYYNNGICDNSIEKAAMDECLAVVIPIYSGAEADITGGALYFHSLPNPTDWAYHNSYTQVYVSGTEKFWFYK